MIEVHELTKRYGVTVAVDRLSFVVRPGAVTGFLGPNGSGKSTTMRVVLGLDAPSSGQALVNGRPYRSMRRPLRQVGALLDAGAVHPARTARSHLGWLARSNQIGQRRVTELLEQVGLASVADTPVGAFSLGMRQRLGIAGALLGDPEVLLFDEPVNGLDPEGVRWLRELFKQLAGEGRTLLLSSHLMSEMALTADRLVVIGRGRLLAETSVAELTNRFRGGVLVRCPRAGELTEALRAAGATVTAEPDGGLLVRGLDGMAIGELAAARGIPLEESRPYSASLEDAYLALTAGSVTFHTQPVHSAATLHATPGHAQPNVKPPADTPAETLFDTSAAAHVEPRAGEGRAAR